MKEPLPKVYVFGKTGVTKESTIGFASMILNLPFTVNCDVYIDLSTDIMEAFKKFVNLNYDVFVCVPCHMSGYDFVRGVLTRQEARSCIVGKFVLPDIKWEESTLVRYNYDVEGGSFVPLPEPLRAIPDVFISYRSVLSPLKEGFSQADLLHALNASAVVDPTTTIGVYAKHVFKGAVGLRSVVR